MTARPPPSQRRVLKTSVCEVSVDAAIADRSGPAILCVRGVWAPISYLVELFEHFPAADMVIGDLPGMWTPMAPVSTPETFARAYDEVIAELLPGREILALGVSTGALVTLGLNRAEVRGHVLMEPFLRTANLWPLISDMRRRIQKFPQKPTLKTYIWELFGYSLDAVEERDFHHLLEGLRVPVRAVYGDLPLLPPRDLPRWPSLADEDTRAALAALPGAKAYGGPPRSGHHVTADDAGWSVLLEALRDGLADIA
jgi:hypothetical protein